MTPAGALVYLFFADGTTPLPAGLTCNGALVPPAHRCDLDGARAPEACRRAIVAHLERWYAAFDVRFTTVAPAGPHQTVVVTSDGRWCGAPPERLGEAPASCQPLAEGAAFVHRCVFSSELCAALIAHEHGHLMGLEHVGSATDIMAAGGCSSCAGFEDRDNPVVPPSACDRASQNAHRWLARHLGSRDGQEPAGGCALGGRPAGPGAAAPLLFWLLVRAACAASSLCRSGCRRRARGDPSIRRSS
jgi:hypothetical protein